MSNPLAIDLTAGQTRMFFNRIADMGDKVNPDAVVVDKRADLRLTVSEFCIAYVLNQLRKRELKRGQRAKGGKKVRDEADAAANAGAAAAAGEAAKKARKRPRKEKAAQATTAEEDEEVLAGL